MLGSVGNKDQQNLFGISPEGEIQEALRLRIESTIAGGAFKTDGHFLPADKSIGNEGPIYKASVSGNLATVNATLIWGKQLNIKHIGRAPVDGGR
ncbi:MAG: hypothetical protein ACI8P0_003190 [Planctomycetaceae bacterium]|jgi:hypothetical protein